MAGKTYFMFDVTQYDDYGRFMSILQAKFPELVKHLKVLGNASGGAIFIVAASVQDQLKALVRAYDVEPEELDVNGFLTWLVTNYLQGVPIQKLAELLDS